jgi:4-hydroxybutyrate CoA-transferase
MTNLTEIKDLVNRMNPGDMLAFGYVHNGFSSLFEGLSQSVDCTDIDVFIPCVFRYGKEYIFPLDKIAGQFPGRFLVTQIAPEFAGCVKKGKTDILPLPLSRVPNYLISQSKKRKVWVFCEISPPDASGICNTGYSAPFPLSLLEKCEAVGLINEAIPSTFGDTAIPAKYFDHFVKMQSGLPLFPEPETSEATRLIGLHAAPLIEDDSTIEGGIGEIITSVLAALSGKQRLRFQSGCMPEDVRALVESGVIIDKSAGNITGARSPGFYEWIKNNPAVEIRTMEYTHNVFQMARQPKFVALGSALAVDLLGQVAAETIGATQITGIGGALDFARASGLGGGKSIIAMASTYGAKNTSKIVPLFDKGDVVSLTRHDVDYIVTEYGIARLKDQPRRDRVRNLISVAHPDNREWLSERAKQLGIL